MDATKLAEKAVPPTAMMDRDAVVRQFHTALYKFGFGLTGNEGDAVELTREACHVLRSKGIDVGSTRSVKSWLFTALYRQFLGQRHVRHSPRPHVDPPSLGLSSVTSCPSGKLDACRVMAAFQDLDETYRAPLALFYLENFSCRDIAEVLGRPVDTIISQISHGKDILQRAFRSRPA